MQNKVIAMRSKVNTLTGYEKLAFLATEKVEGKHVIEYSKGKVYGSYLSGGDISGKGKLILSFN